MALLVMGALQVIWMNLETVECLLLNYSKICRNAAAVVVVVVVVVLLLLLPHS